MKEGEGKETVEGDKSCRAIAVSWFMAMDGQTSIVFRVHFKGGEPEHNVTLSTQSVDLSSPENL